MSKKFLIYAGSKPEDSQYIEIGKIYTVENKPDMNAPDGYRKLGTTKYPNPVVGAKYLGLAVFDNKKGNIANPFYDTFLSEYSTTLKNMYKNGGLEVAIESLKESIVDPVEFMYGEGKLDPKSAFWRSPEGRVKIYSGKRFNTNDPLELMQLYCLIMNKELAPKGLENKNEYVSNASFVVTNVEETTDIRTRNEFAKTQAIFKFGTLLNTDKVKLYNLLDYLGISTSIEEDTKDSEMIITTIFTEYLSESEQNVGIFNKHYQDFIEKKSGGQLLVIFKNLKAMAKEGIIKIEYGNLILEDVVVGSNFKDAAFKISAEKDKKELYTSNLTKLNKTTK